MTINLKNPEDYEPSGIRLKEAYTLGLLSGDAMMQTVKNLVITKGAVKISYYAGKGATDPYGTSTTAYFNNEINPSTGKLYTPNHAVSIIGWDDDFPLDTFDSSMRPKKNGAWLVRNSWGTGWGNAGYFWMSYEQYIRGVTVFIADKTDKNLKHYGYDDLGGTWTSTYKWNANIFTAEEDEIIRYVGFYTINNNENYEIYIYDLGADNSSSPTAGELLLSHNGSSAYSGYHTENLSSYNKKITKGHKFSVVIKSDSGTALEGEVQWGNGNDYAKPVHEAGVSYYSSSGQTWSERSNSNVCIKAFTVPADSEPTPDTGLIPIDTVHFPDDVFRRYVSDNFDRDSNGYLNTAEIKSATKIEDLFHYLAIVNSDVYSIKGIEYFNNLKWADLGYTEITEANLSQNTAITYLNLYGAKLATIDLSNNTAITELNLSANLRLKTLDLTKHTALTTLNLNYARQLEKIDLRNNTALTQLYFAAADKITEIDLSKNTALTDLVFNAKNLTEIDLTHNTALKELEITGTKLTTIDVAKNIVLESLLLANNKLTSIDLSKSTALKYLWLYNNKLTWLDLSKNTNLTGTVSLSSQTSNTLTYTKSGSDYQVALKDYVKDSSKVSSVKGYDSSGNEITQTQTYNASAGTVIFASAPAKVTYLYDTQCVKEDAKYLDVTLNVPVAIITDSITKTARTGESCNIQLEAYGAPDITAWSITGGRLPQGLSLAASTGIISGTPSESGSFTFIVKASNSAGSAQKDFTINVAPKITTASILPDTMINTSPSFALKVYGSSSGINWKVTSGTLPAGLALNANNGVISGKAAQTGEKKFKVRAYVNDNSSLYDEREFELKINGIAPKINTASLSAGTINKAYSLTLQASGTGPLTWKAIGLPNGLSLKNNQITGTPSKLGKFSVKLTLSSAWGTQTKTLQLVINNVKPSFTTSSLSAATINSAYNQTVKANGAASGDNLKYKFAWSGAKIQGLSFNTSTGKITGKPSSKAGNYKLNVTITNSAGSVSKTFTIALKDIKPVITTKTLANAIIGEAYSTSFKASGSALTWQMSWSGNKISGLTLNNNKALISGKPATNSKAGTYKLKVTAKNSAGSASKTFVIKLAKPAKPKITTTTLANATIGKSYNASLKASGSALTWQMSWVGNKITGLTLNNNKALISGKPSASNKAGTYKLKVTAKNLGGSVSKTFAIKLTAAKSKTVSKAAAKISRIITPEVFIAVNNNADRNTSSTVNNQAQAKTVKGINRSTQMTAGMIITIEGKEYITACVLDAVSVNESGQYDFNAQIHENIKTGAKLIWKANPINADYSEDDEIIDFYDNEDGSPVDSVPESHSITISPWLRAGVIYEPVIVVEAK